MDGTAKDGLNEAIVNAARRMRHDGMRLAISTQSPRALAPELLELLTCCVMHRFHSRDWLLHLEQKLPLQSGDAAWNALVDLEPGRALVFASQQAATIRGGLGGGGGAGGGGGGGQLPENLKPGLFGRHVTPVRIRPRLTADRGQSRRNNKAGDQ